MFKSLISKVKNFSVLLIWFISYIVSRFAISQNEVTKGYIFMLSELGLIIIIAIILYLNGNDKKAYNDFLFYVGLSVICFFISLFACFLFVGLGFPIICEIMSLGMTFCYGLFYKQK